MKMSVIAAALFISFLACCTSYTAHPRIAPSHSTSSRLGARRDSKRKSFGKAVAEGEPSSNSKQQEDVAYINDNGIVPLYVSSRETQGEFEKYDLLRPIAQAPMTKKTLTFISSNALKIAEVKSILLDDSDGCHFPYDLECQGAELLEPQATPIEISRAKCIQALRLVQDGGPVCVEDTSLHFNALHGMPGPYIKSFFESMGNEGLAMLLEGFEDRTAYAQCVVSFSHGINSEIHTFCGVSEGIITTPLELEERRKNGFGWDDLFIPDKGGGRTFGELSLAEKNRLSHRYKAFRQLKSFINDRGDRWVA